MLVAGIDPGESCGIAYYNHGVLTALDTHAPEEILLKFFDRPDMDLVIIEDSRLQSVIFDRGTNERIKLKIARDVGGIDFLCRHISAYCARANIPLIAISPLDKGRKLDAFEFNKITGWTGKSNQHTRDAAIVAWPFRHGAKFEVG